MDEKTTERIKDIRSLLLIIVWQIWLLLGAVIAIAIIISKPL